MAPSMRSVLLALCLSFVAVQGRSLLAQDTTISLDELAGPDVFTPADPNFLRFIVIGDFGRQGDAESVGTYECSEANFAGDNYAEGASQQRETAFLMDEVCGKIGGCQFIVNTGDNFYECGVYPGSDYRLKKDWYAVYKNPEITPNIAYLKWYTTFGNHDVPINGSVEQQIAFSKLNPDWVMPATSFSQDWSFAGISLRGIFFDSIPFITKYNKPNYKYNTLYYSSHHNSAYINKTTKFVESHLKSSKAQWTFTVTHFPLFGTSTQYGVINASALQNGQGYPGEFNGWALTEAIVKKYKPVAYFNGHDHSMALANVPASQYNKYTSYVTTGAGSWGESGDSCGDYVKATGYQSWKYSNGGNGGFVIISANTTQWRTDYYTLGSNYPQCTVITYIDKTKEPVVGANCATGVPNTCCSYTGTDAHQQCYKKR